MFQRLDKIIPVSDDDHSLDVHIKDRKKNGSIPEIFRRMLDH